MNKKVLILGIDGYIGWALANELKGQGYEVYGMDNYFLSVIRDTLLTLMPYKHLINKDIIYPTTNWR